MFRVAQMVNKLYEYMLNTYFFKIITRPSVIRTEGY